jgi:PAS domain-containing protein
MTSVANGSEQARQAQDIRLVVDAIPTLAWSARADGSADFFNQRWLDYTGFSAEQARDWGWTGCPSPRRSERPCGLLAIRSGFWRAR